MEFFIVFVHFVAISTPLLILVGVAVIGLRQPVELVSQGHRDFARPAAAIWDALADEPRLRLWAGERNNASAYTVERTQAALTLSRRNSSGSYRETWTVTVEERGGHSRLLVAQAVYARSPLYRGAMRLFFPPAAEYERLFLALASHLST